MVKKALHTFMEVEELRGIGAKSLSVLLEPHTEFMSAIGVTLTDDDDAFPFDELADGLQRKQDAIPFSLVDALYLITEMADSTGMDMLIDIALREDLIDADESEELSPADIAVRLYLHDAELLRERRNRRVVERKRSFIFDSAGRPYTRLPFQLDPAMQRRFEMACRDEFRRRQRGDGVQLKAYPEGDIIRFLVLHGESITRQGIIHDGASASILFRPAKYDAFHFDPRRGVLGMPNGSQWQQKLYRSLFGQILYGDRDAFQARDLFTLDPLIHRGKASLDCPMVQAVDEIRLESLEWVRGGINGGPWSGSATDLFASFNEQGIPFPEAGLKKARFVLQAAGTAEKRYMEIQGTRKMKLQRDTDLELLWPWLDAQEFLARPTIAEAEVDEELADALA